MTEKQASITQIICRDCEYYPCESDPQKADYCPLRGTNEVNGRGETIDEELARDL